jgi:ferrous iron transport protein B
MNKSRVALLGMPNTGKSTLFNRLSGARARVGNWPGITVELESAPALIGTRMIELVDLPGMHNLHGFSEDEQVARHFLEQQAVHALIVVLNASQLDRQLGLVLQLQRLRLPLVVALNMADEATQRQVFVDRTALEQRLQAPVCLISAKYGQGMASLLQALEKILQLNPEPQTAEQDALQEDDQIEHESAEILQQVLRTPETAPVTYSDHADHWLLHPWLGLPAFFLILLGLFQIVYGVGSPLQNLLAEALEMLKTQWLEPSLVSLPTMLSSFLLDGLYDGIGTVATFYPIILVFYLVMSAVEDSGYLSRAAFLMDTVMSRMGLDGRAFVMQILGFGCNVPAIIGTRVLRNPGQRRLAMLVIPFSLCSARLQVFLFFTTAVFSPSTAPWALFSLYLLSFVIAFASAWIWRGKAGEQEPLVMEMPPYRRPTLRYLLLRALREAAQFLRSAGGFIVIGVALVWLLTHMPFDATPASAETWAGQLATLTSPLFEPLGISALLSIALLFGFVAKEIVIGALAVIYGAGPEELSGLLAQQMGWQEAYSFMLFTLLYTPCLATIAAIRHEARSLGFAALTTTWSLLVAWTLAFSFYQLATL